MLANSIRRLKSDDSFVRNPDIDAPDKQANKCGTTYCEAVKLLERCCFPHKTFVLIFIFTSSAYSILTWYWCSFTEQTSGSVPHLSKLLAATLLPAIHALLDILINLEDRRLSLSCKQCKHSTVVDTYDVEIVTVRNLSPTKSSYPLTSHRVPAHVPRHG